VITGVGQPVGLFPDLDPALALDQGFRGIKSTIKIKSKKRWSETASCVCPTLPGEATAVPLYSL
jgi:hypothetical protein